MEGHVDRRPGHRLHEHAAEPPEPSVGEHLGVVLQAHHPPVLKPHERHVGKREQQVPEKRKHDHGEDHGHRRHRKQVGGGIPAEITHERHKAWPLPHEQGEQPEAGRRRHDRHEGARLEPAMHDLDKPRGVGLHPLRGCRGLERAAEHGLVGRPHAVPDRPQLGRHGHQPAVLELGPRGREGRVGREHRIVPDRLTGREHPQPLHEPPLHVLGGHVPHKTHGGLRRRAAGVGVERVALRSHHRSHG